jgi:hypothetical protein
MASPTKIPASRLQIRQGTLVLSFPMLPPLSGLLMDLSELGCRGALALDQLEPAVAAEWQKTLSPKRPMHIRLDVPPYLQEFEIDGAVVVVDSNGARPEVDFAFHHTTPANRNILAQAVLTLATERVRQAGVQRSIAAGAAHLSSASGVRPVPIVPPAPAGAPAPRSSTSGRNAAQSAKSASKPFEMSAPPPKAQAPRPPPAQPPPPAPAPGPRLIPVPLSAPIPIRPPAHEPSAPAPSAAHGHTPMPAPRGHITRSGPGHISRSEPRSLPPMDSPPPADLPENGWGQQPPEIIPAPDDPPPQMPQKHESAILKNPQLARAAATMPTQGAVVPSTHENQLLRVKKVGEVLVHMGRLNAEQVSVAVQQSRANGERLGRYLLRTGLVSADALCRALALQTGLPMTDLSDAVIPENLGRVFPHELMMQYSFVPFDEAKSFVCIAVADPLPQPTVRDLEKLCGKRIEVFLGQEDLVIRLLDKARGKQKRKLRRHIRYEISALARYQFCSRLGNPAEDVIHHGTTMNVSEGGFLIEGTPTILGSPDDLRRRGICARVVLTGTFQEISALCHLRSIRAKERQEAGKARWLLGVEVAEISADDRRRLKELCLKAVSEKIKEAEE